MTKRELRIKVYQAMITAAGGDSDFIALLKALALKEGLTPSDLYAKVRA